LGPAIDQTRVDLIREPGNAPALEQIENAFELAWLGASPRGVARSAENDQRRAFGQAALDNRGDEPETRFSSESVRRRRGADEPRHGGIGGIAGVGIQHVAARIDQSQTAHVERLL